MTTLDEAVSQYRTAVIKTYNVRRNAETILKDDLSTADEQDACFTHLETAIIDEHRKLTLLLQVANGVN